ncbi:TIR domain-containing protein [Microbacterium foliorum]|uniref:TIR domain-containing protein n=1 Tax=Microbacterium foliorum TaxID=104336 RepID=UPI001DB496CD|nr:nucleotide-binding protein [Microbacterium foliorum]CAH0138291.1 hypothetical protein SRABI03_00449 [Microbacterium foliorum]CAH0208702.1 hypothetical protein SRABI44_02114 [Microbacterium foliorum]
MHKTAYFPNVHFDASTARSAIAALNEIAEDMHRKSMLADVSEPSPVRFITLELSRPNVQWGFDTLDEFLVGLGDARRANDFEHSVLDARIGDSFLGPSIRWTQRPNGADVSVSDYNRSTIEKIHAVFSDAAPSLTVLPPEPLVPAPKPRIFVGHGGKSSAWRDLTDHLRDQQGLDVVAYETGSRAGHSIRDILEDMLEESSFAVLVFTPEDAHQDGTQRARQNVVHEAGLFQGRLGFARAIVVRQGDTELLSNLAGIQYIPFASNIRETYGEVLAAIRREFGPF